MELKPSSSEINSSLEEKLQIPVLLNHPLTQSRDAKDSTELWFKIFLMTERMPGYSPLPSQVLTHSVKQELKTQDTVANGAPLVTKVFSTTTTLRPSSPKVGLDKPILLTVRQRLNGRELTLELVRILNNPCFQLIYALLMRLTKNFKSATMKRAAMRTHGIVQIVDTARLNLLENKILLFQEVAAVHGTQERVSEFTKQ